MEAKQAPSPGWQPPRLERLGRLKDVAGGFGAGTQSSQQNRS